MNPNTAALLLTASAIGGPARALNKLFPARRRQDSGACYCGGSAKRWCGGPHSEAKLAKAEAKRERRRLKRLSGGAR